MTPLNASSTSARLVPLAFGDLQGCRGPFQKLLARAAPPDGTPLWFAGDLINRGPDSLDTLRDAVPVLGNHDLHLLSVSAGIRKSKKGDTIEDILAAPDAADLLEWIRHRPLAHFDNGMLMVHAGVLPQWDATLTLELADELQRALGAPNWKETLAGLYGNESNRWKPGLKGIERLRVTCSALTRMRFCSADGVMDFSSSGTLASTPSGCMPWFDVPSRQTADACAEEPGAQHAVAPTNDDQKMRQQVEVANPVVKRGQEPRSTACPRTRTPTRLRAASAPNKSPTTAAVRTGRSTRRMSARPGRGTARATS
ncbi:bis(5'-nucleosyl)-tetraphosphatase (symmetrical) [Paraburkholderia sp. WSM4179]|nr:MULTISPECIES: symmetrical bis(5'-nucleosyl)-tetraphosphatase [Paraburkholderia]MDH6148890.1 bis(5'-nucleosyl)-tetraphosphatase (symmetrical) [Paraburkholderia sp. WSM4179]